MQSNFYLDNLYIADPLIFDNISVFQLGRMFCSGTTVVDEHVHSDLFELTVVTGGVGAVITNGVPITVGRGDIYLSFPFDTHKIVSDPESPLKYDFFAFNCDDKTIKSELDNLAQDYHSPYTRVFRDERINQTIGNALAELNSKYIFNSELMTVFLREILIYMIRDFKNIVPDKHRGAASQAEILCYQIMHYIDTHIYSMKNLKEISNITNYSYGYLSALFKKTTSQNLSYYYNEKKSDIARILIVENRLKIAEIAEMLNYSSVYAFSKAFSGRFGISPREYRKLHADK